MMARITKIIAFTLAEILITLGIIGIVAEMTIPTLIKTYQKQAYLSMLKLTYSEITQGFKMAMAIDFAKDFGDTELMSVVAKNGGDTDIPAAETAAVDVLKKYFASAKFIPQANIVSLPDQTCNGLVGTGIRAWNLSNRSQCSGNPNMAFGLSNGVVMQIWLTSAQVPPISSSVIDSLGGKMHKTYGRLDIDLNGSQGPNQWGKDAFRFRISEKGELCPNYGKDYAIFAVGNNWQTQWWSTVPSFCSTSSGEGWGCAARIIESNWEIDYY